LWTVLRDTCDPREIPGFTGAKGHSIDIEAEEAGADGEPATALESRPTEAVHGDRDGHPAADKGVIDERFLLQINDPAHPAGKESSCTSS
jgi:hypothetical protein